MINYTITPFCAINHSSVSRKILGFPPDWDIFLKKDYQSFLYFIPVQYHQFMETYIALHIRDILTFVFGKSLEFY